MEFLRLVHQRLLQPKVSVTGRTASTTRTAGLPPPRAGREGAGDTEVDGLTDTDPRHSGGPGEVEGVDEGEGGVAVGGPPASGKPATTWGTTYD